MKCPITELLIPPLATHRRGAAAVCTGPIAVFWVTALVSLAYGFVGGPLGDGGVSWLIVALGLFMWAIASAWAMLVLKGHSEDDLGDPQSTSRSRVEPERYEDDPFEEVK